MKEIPGFVSPYPVSIHGHTFENSRKNQDPVKCLPADTMKIYLINIGLLVL